MAARREKGLCYNCDESFVPGHKCKQLISYMILTDAEGDDPDEILGMDLQLGGASDHTPLEELHISLNSLEDSDGTTTMRIFGACNQQTLHILIDSGSTISFIGAGVAKRLNCKLTPAKPLLVKVANGQQMRSDKRVDSFTWNMHEHQFCHTFRLLDTDCCDLILGGDWLKSCTPIELDYDHMVITVNLGGERVKLQALTTDLSCKLISNVGLHHLLHLTTDVEECYLVSCCTVQEEVPSDLHSLLTAYQDIFDEPKGLPPPRGVEHQILLKPRSMPKQQFPYRTSHAHKEKIERIVQELLDSGFIQNSRSPFASSVILVKKKDGMWRLCVDYRYLNDLTVKHNYPIPIIDELLDELYGAKFFSKIDLRSGYFQILMDHNHRHLTAFRTHNGHYEFLVMPFGLCNAPATFQSLMNQIFREYLRKSVLVFFYDILVYSLSWTLHLQHLESVLKILREQSLYAKRSKCHFGQTKVEYLGHIISGDGIATDPNKISSMLSWPKPRTLKQLRGFLGLKGYYRKFVKGYGAISSPLTSLLKKDNFHWTAEADDAFQKLKNAMSTAPVLGLPDFTK